MLALCNLEVCPFLKMLVCHLLEHYSIANLPRLWELCAHPRVLSSAQHAPPFEVHSADTFPLPGWQLTSRPSVLPGVP